MRKTALVGLITLIFAISSNMAISKIMISPKGTVLDSDEIKYELENIDLKDLPESNVIKTIEKFSTEVLGDNPTDANLQLFLLGVQDGANSKLPKDLGDGVIFNKVKAGKKSLTYNYEVHGIDLSLKSTDDMKSTLIEDTRVCDSLSYLFRYGITMNFDYQYNNDKFLKIELKPSDCGF